MGKKFVVLVTVVIASVFLAAALYAGTEVKDVISMTADYEHTKGIVEFSHKKHMEEYAQKYPDLYKDGCGVCHHNDKNEPLKDLKAGDDVKTCIECHKKPGEVPKSEKNAMKKLSKDEKFKAEMEYHAEALHENCRGCHKDHQKATKSKDAPTTCNGCHPKK